MNARTRRFANLAAAALVLLFGLRRLLVPQDVEVLLDGATIRASWGTMVPAAGALEVTIDPGGARPWTGAAPAAGSWSSRSAELRDVPAGRGTIVLRGAFGLPVWSREIPRHRFEEPHLTVTGRQLAVTVAAESVRKLRLFHGESPYHAVVANAPPYRIECALPPQVDHGTLKLDVEHERERRLVTRWRIGARVSKLLESTKD